MDRETNSELIETLDQQIAEGKGDTIKLKRTRNSLLNISIRIPPEVLGYIFVWAIAREQDYPLHPLTCFKSLRKGSYSFLLVCHHWFEVASRTPEVWSFWGNTLEDWNKRYRCHRATAIDLVLQGHGVSSQVLDTPLQYALRDRATRDKIRQIHLQGNNHGLLGVILSTLTPDGEGVQKRSIKSIILQTVTIPEELLDFFAQSQLPQLQWLDITGTLHTSLWDHLASQTTHLTALSLQLFRSSLSPTTSQLTSILISNPHLEDITLWHASLPGKNDESEIQVPLPRLKSLTLGGNFWSVFRLLLRLELPAVVDRMSLHMENSTSEDIHQTLGPYMQNLFQRDTKLRYGLSVNIRVNNDFKVLVNHTDSFLQPSSEQSARFEISITGQPPDLVVKKLHHDLMAFIPGERVESLRMEHTLEVPEAFFISMPNLGSLWLDNVTLSDGFLQPSLNGPHINKKLLPSLQTLCLVDLTVEDDNWEPLITYLAHQATNGQEISFQLVNFKTSDVPARVRKQIEDLVKKLDFCFNDW